MLVRRCIAGDVVAWEEIVERYSRQLQHLLSLCRLRRRFPGVTQELFIEDFPYLESYDVERGAFMTCVNAITRNLLVDHFRKSKQDRMTDSLDAAPSEHEDSMPLSDKIEDKGPSADTSVQGRETRELVHHALQKLSPSYARRSSCAICKIWITRTLPRY